MSELADDANVEGRWTIAADLELGVLRSPPETSTAQGKQTSTLISRVSDRGLSRCEECCNPSHDPLPGTAPRLAARAATSLLFLIEYSSVAFSAPVPIALSKKGRLEVGS